VSRLTTVSHVDDRDPRAFLIARRDHERAFRAAQRHSRIVRALRISLPVSIAFGCVATFVLFTWFDPWQERDRPGMSVPVVSGNTIVMRQPRIGGFTRDDRPYTVTARSAAQDRNNPDVLELQEIRAVLAAPGDQGDIELVAATGIYDGKTERLALKNNITLKSPAYMVRLKEAHVEVKSGNVISNQPVEIDMLQGTIRSNRLEVIKSGEVVLFDGGVSLVLHKDEEATGSTTARAGAK
jgi:lipopolysaccharide export system protein LptC